MTLIMSLDNLNSKVCKHCGVEKMLEEFNKHRGCSLGRRPECTVCTRISYSNNRESRIKSSRNWQESNKERCVKIKKEWLEENKEYAREYSRVYSASRKGDDPVYKLKCRLRNLIYICVKKKLFSDRLKTKTAELLGCCTSDFKKHIESQFKEGMSFENYGEWELDHKEPLKFAKTEDEVIELFYYTNLQPLWASENREKGVNRI
jgi:hypothetical protein